MKKMFLISVSIIMAAAIILVAYGSFLNYESERVINLRMENRILDLKGARAKNSTFLPVWHIDSLRLTAEHMTDAISRQEGILEEVFVEENDYVTKGQPICRIGNEDIPIQLAQIDVNIAKANAVVTRYKNSYERYKKLRDFGAVSLEQYEEIETNYKAALEEVKQLQLQREQYEIQQRRLVVNAPLNGEVLMLYKNAGSFLTTGASVALIGDFSNLEFTDVVNDDELNRLGDLSLPGELVINKRDLDKIYNNSYNQGNKGIMQKFNVKITAVEPPLEVEADMRTVHWSVDNSSGLLEPRRYQDATIYAVKERQNLLIPKEALIDNLKDKVFVWDEKTQQLELRNIITGTSDENFIEVLRGLDVGEIVIISGKEGLKEGQKVSVDIESGEIDG